jgi:hypothetical protein
MLAEPNRTGLCIGIALLAALHLSHCACELLERNRNELQFRALKVAEIPLIGHWRMILHRGCQHSAETSHKSVTKLVMLNHHRENLCLHRDDPILTSPYCEDYNQAQVHHG